MHISWLRARIIIQKNQTVIDQYGNHKSEWKDYLTGQGLTKDQVTVILNARGWKW